eukprot:6179034-Pleurochrysis_carterae.AAC.2
MAMCMPMARAQHRKSVHMRRIEGVDACASAAYNWRTWSETDHKFSRFQCVRRPRISVIR